MERPERAVLYIRFSWNQLSLSVASHGQEDAYKGCLADWIWSHRKEGNGYELVEFWVVLWLELASTEVFCHWGWMNGEDRSAVASQRFHWLVSLAEKNTSQGRCESFSSLQGGRSVTAVHNTATGMNWGHWFPLLNGEDWSVLECLRRFRTMGFYSKLQKEELG